MHVKIEGGLEVTVLQGTRLKASLLEKDPSCYAVYCTATLGELMYFYSFFIIVVRYFILNILFIFVLNFLNILSLNNFYVKIYT